MTQRPDLLFSLHSAAASAVLLAALPLPDAAEAPEWVHLLPAGTARTQDGRGPYMVADAAALCAESLEAAGGRMVLDENHATDLAAPKGEPAPARGWITALETRADGIWGRVDWTSSGRALMADRAYRHISPAILHRPDGQVTQILRASLVNRPNLKGLTALHQERTMSLQSRLAAALGLDASASEEELIAAVSARDPKPALQAVLDPIAGAVGLAAGTDASAVLAGVERLAKGEKGQVAALQGELAGVTARLNSLTQQAATEKAVTFVDGEIRRGRVGVKPLRDHYIAMHAENPARVEKEIAALPILGPGEADLRGAEPPSDGEVALNAAERQAASLLGIDPKSYAATLKAERAARL